MDERNMEERIQQKSKKILGICILVVVIVYFLITSSRSYLDITYDSSIEAISISYNEKNAEHESIVIPAKDIEKIYYTEDIDFGTFVSGVQDNKINYGKWINDEFGEYNLCIHTKMNGYAVIKTSLGYTVFNVESAETTSEFVDALITVVEEDK